MIVADLPAAPTTSARRRCRTTTSVFREASQRLAHGGGKVFVGQRDDPFFVDLGVTFDSINFRPGTGR